MPTIIIKSADKGSAHRDDYLKESKQFGGLRCL